MDPSPLVPDDAVDVEVLLLAVFEVDWVEFACAAAVRSPKRLVVPRIAPRLEVGAPGAPAVAACAFKAVLVLVEVESVWVEEPLEEDEDVDEVELLLLDAVVDVLEELVEDEAFPTSDLPEP